MSKLIPLFEELECQNEENVVFATIVPELFG